MRLAFVVQRYGLEIRGGAELHCRLVAELLARHHDVEVVTTCATDYLTWANDYTPGINSVNGLAVWRFPVARARDLNQFGQLQERVFHRDHTDEEARAWLDSQGPYTPAMMDWIGEYRDRFDYWVCFSYRYWTTYHAMRIVRGKGILVPTAEPDPTIDVPLFHPLFRDARAIVFNSHEERRMIVDRSGAGDVPGDIVGVGIQESSLGVAHGDGPLQHADAERFRREFAIADPFYLYVGRIDENKGCKQLFEFHQRAVRRAEESGARAPLLVLAGKPVIPIPEDDRIRHVGAIDEQQKYDALAAASLLVMPSFYESLSMVLLEAWAMHKPVLVNAHCEVLRGQVERSSGGLFYADGDEFVASLTLLMDDAKLRDTCGRGGRDYFTANYLWPVIEAKYQRMLEELAA